MFFAKYTDNGLFLLLRGITEPLRRHYGPLE